MWSTLITSQPFWWNPWSTHPLWTPPQGALSEGRLCLASFCCHFLRDACNHKKDHQGRRHAKPQSSLVACNFRADCPHGHWRNIVETATGTLSQVQQGENKEVEMPVSQIRWCHDSIKVVFQDGQLVAMMLKQLVDGDLLLHQIPQIEVLEDDALLYAWTGNRRLWVFKEFERLRKQEVRIKVKKKATKLPRKNQKFSTTNEGESVRFFSHKRDDSFPSMSFALAAINLMTAPTAWDVKLGDAICRAEGGLPLWKIQSMGDLGAQQNAPEDLLNYFLSKPYLFVITQGAVDHVVSLTCCLDALKILELNVDPLEIPSLRSLEGEQDSVVHFWMFLTALFLFTGLRYAEALWLIQKTYKGLLHRFPNPFLGGLAHAMGNRQVCYLVFEKILMTNPAKDTVNQSCET